MQRRRKQEVQNEIMVPLAINPVNYKEIKIIYLLINKGIVLNNIICPKFNKKMKSEKN